MYYLALVLDAPDGGYDFVIPDIPGFTAHADTSDFSEAVAVAREVLTGHLAATVDANIPLSEARDPADVRNDPEFADDFAEAVTTIMLPALVPAGRTMRVNLSLDEGTIGLIDAGARDRGLTRSAFVAEAAKRFVATAAEHANTFSHSRPAAPPRRANEAGVYRWTIFNQQTGHVMASGEGAATCRNTMESLLSDMAARGVPTWERAIRVEAGEDVDRLAHQSSPSAPR